LLEPRVLTFAVRGVIKQTRKQQKQSTNKQLKQSTNDKNKQITNNQQQTISKQKQPNNTQKTNKQPTTKQQKQPTNKPQQTTHNKQPNNKQTTTINKQPTTNQTTKTTKQRKNKSKQPTNNQTQTNNRNSIMSHTFERAPFNDSGHPHCSLNWGPRGNSAFDKKCTAIVWELLRKNSSREWSSKRLDRDDERQMLETVWIAKSPVAMQHRSDGCRQRSE
jgi:DNA mismatch repair ATPase MutL